MKRTIYYIGGPEHGRSLDLSVIYIAYREYNKSIRVVRWNLLRLLTGKLNVKSGITDEREWRRN